MAKKISTGRLFEKRIEKTFDPYYAMDMAVLAPLPVPMSPVGVHAKMKRLVYVPSGKSPFDVYGYRIGVLMGGQFIGAELKSSERKNTLPIVAPDKKGRGVHFHQLEALAMLAKAGGHAVLLWENGDDVGSLSGANLVAIMNRYRDGLNSMNSGKGFPKDERSIPWSEFYPVREVKIPTGEKLLDWLQFFVDE